VAHDAAAPQDERSAACVEIKFRAPHHAIDATFSPWSISTPAAAVDVARVEVQGRVGDEEGRPHCINVRVEHHRDGDERRAEVPEPPRARVRMNHAGVAARLPHERDAFS